MTDKDRITLLRAALYEAKGKLFEASGAVRALSNAAYADEFKSAATEARKALDEDARIAQSAAAKEKQHGD